MRTCWIYLCCALAVAVAQRRGEGYIDISPTLGRIVAESHEIAVVRVEKMHRDHRVVVYRKVEDIKGRLADGPIKHLLTDGHPPREPRHILDWAAEGQVAVVFAYRGTMLLCTGTCWYEAHSAGGGGEGEGVTSWWRMSLDRPELALVYCGSPNRLAKHAKEILEGKKVVVTTLAHGAQGRGAFSECVFNDMQAGALPPVQRLYASLRMPGRVYDIDTSSPWFVGMGAIGKQDLPTAVKALDAAEARDRIDALNDLASLGSDAKEALLAVRKLFADPDVRVRLSAATAVALIDSQDRQAVQVLIAGLSDPSPLARRLAAQCIARIGARGASALNPLMKLVTGPDPDADVRVAAIGAVGRIGAAAGGAAPELIKLLDDAGLRCAAAESLGRIGPAAAAALPALAKALSDANATWQWTASRAMVLIGGEGARPVVPFLVSRTERAPRGRELYQLTWLLGLMGPVAKDAVPVLRDAQERDNELASMAVWAILPEEVYPWQIGYRADRPCDLWLFADYIERMGERATPAAGVLAKRILEGTAGRVPSWGYHLMRARPEAAVPVLRKGLESGDAGVRARAERALAELSRK
jgi:HEAT repeat protein